MSGDLYAYFFNFKEHKQFSSFETYEAKINVFFCE